MNTLTKKDKLALQVSLALVAGMFSLIPVAQGAPVLDEVVSGGADINPGTNTTITSKNTNNVINWKDFSIAKGESVTFDGGATKLEDGARNYLNVVTGNATSYINGAMKGGHDVYLVNPQGVIMGESADVKVGNLYVSTQDLSGLDGIIKGADDWKGTASILDPSTVQSEVVNLGKIQAESVYVEGKSIRFLNAANVTSDGINPLKGVVLKGEEYVHVGYDEGSKIPTKDLNYDITSPEPANMRDHILIYDATQLQNMENTKSYMLAKDIDLDPEEDFTPVGSSLSNAYTGSFDGNYHTINYLLVEGEKYAGLFGCTDGAKIRNLGMKNAYVLANEVDGNSLVEAGYGGAVVGYAKNTLLENVYSVQTDTQYEYKIKPYEYKLANTGYEICKSEAIGGLVGAATGDTVINSCYNSLDVYNGGGLVGSLENSTIKNSYNTGRIINWVRKNDDTYNVGIHYAIADKVTGNSTIDNVYNTGGRYIYNVDKGTTTLQEIASLADDISKVTDGYVITTGTDETTGDLTAEATYAGVEGGNNATGRSTDGLKAATDGLKAATYGIFTDEEGKTKSSNDYWRIYEGHSLPLLRSFLKNKPTGPVGTVPVGYKLSLYANKNDDTPVMKMKGSSANGKVTYNGYWMGIDKDDIVMDDTRGLASGKVKTSTTEKIKNVTQENETPVTFFYSTGQDGYDLATESLAVEARPLAKGGDIKNVDKVYDGTYNAAASLSDYFTQVIDLRDKKYKDKDGLVVDPGYGVVAVYDVSGNKVHVDDVMLNEDAYTARYTYTDADGVHDQINATVDSVKNTDHPNRSEIKVSAISSDLLRSHVEGEEGYAAGSANDYKNYVLKKSDIKGVKITGDITLRPVKVGLHTGNYDDNNATIIEKVYDKSDQVVLGSNSDVYAGWTPNEGNTVTAKDNVYLANGDTDTGLVYKTVENQDDKVRLVVSTPYYSNSNGVVSDAGTGYKTNYQFVLSGDNASNYQVQDLDGNKLDLITNNDNDESYYLLNGKGAINKRSIKADSISFANKDDVLVERTADPNQSSVGDVHGTKVYDNSTNFFYNADKPNTSEYAAKVLFDTTNTITPDAALNHTQEDGFIWDPNDPNDAASLDKLKNALTLNGAEFSGANVDGVTIEENKVDNKITYSVKADPNSDIWKNYTLDGQNVTGTAVPIVREGNITHRIITVGMRDGIGSIDKNYDTTADVVDNNNVGYVKFHDPNATGGQDDGGYVTYAGSTKLVGNDGVVWDISGAYQEVPAAQTHNNKKVDAADVYLDADGNPAAKGIIYSVGLTGTKAPNYIIKNAAETDDEALARVGAGTDKASLNATGVIDQLELMPVFASITKQYDGTAYVLPQTVTMSDGSEKELVPKKIEDATTNPVTYKSAEEQINITLPGLLDEGKVKVDTTSPDFSAVYNSANVSEANKVYYSGLKLASTDDSSKINNYKIANTGTGTGNITKLKLDEANLTPKYNDIKKTYDNDNVLDNAASFVKDIGISGVAGTGAKLTVLDGTTAAYTDKNRRGQDDNHAVNFTFKVKDESGNYYFGDNPSTNEFSFSKGTTGKLLARDVLVTVNDNLTKTYDAMEEYTDGNRNPQSGDKVLKLEGLLGNDKNKNVSTAKYNDANASATSGDKTVYYKPVLNAEDNTNYRLVNDEGNTVDENGKIYDTDGNEIGSLTGSGTINKRPLTLKFADLSKKYDGTADLTGENVAAIAVTLDDGLNGAVIGADGTSVNKANLDTDYSYGVLDNTGFSSNANAGTANAVQYNGIDDDVLGDKIVNYSLYYKYGDNDATAVVNGTGYGLGSIGKKKLAYTDFAATFNDVTKVYDATDAVKADGGVNTLVNSFTINGETVDYATSGNSGYSIASANYGTMDNSGTFTPNVNAGTQSAGTQNAVFKFTIGSDWEDNYDFADLANSPYFDSATRTVAINTAADNGNATITAKTIYAALLDSNHYVSPNKVYDGTKTVKTAAGQPVGNDLTSSGTSARFGDYLTISGLEGNDANIVKVNAAYNDANVAQTVAGLGNAVNYTVNLGSVAGNYDLQGVDDDNKLQGAGVITPKDVYLNVTEAIKNYDGHSDVKMTAGNGVSNVPKFTIEGTVNGENGQESITYTASEDTSKNITGNYLDANLDPDANVALEGNNVVHKAVRYGNVVLDNMTAVNTALSNYRLASGGGGTYDADNHTVTFDKTTAKGKIEKLQVNNIVAAYNDPEVKVYDGTTSLTYNHTAYDATNNPEGYFDDQVKEVTSIGSVKGVQINADGYSVVLDSADDYSVRGSYENADEGPGKKVNYEFTVDKTVFNNLIYSQYNGGDYTFTDSTNNNTIKAKKIYATLNDVNPTKTYDGSKLIIDKAYDGNNKITQQIANSYVNVKGLMGNDAGNYTVTPTYTDKNVARVDGNVVNKGVNYEVGGINHNYQLYVGDTANNVLKGQGLINPKEITLNVTPVEKVYDGTDKTAIDISAANPTITTGVIDADTNSEETFILDKDLISGQYGNYDANGFEANGDVNYGTNYIDSAGYKAVQYKGLNKALTKGNYSGTANVDNYELVGTMSANNPSGYIYDATQGTITFSEEGAKGRITRRQLDNLKTKWESASKEYDAYTDIEEKDRDNTFKIYTDVLGTDPEKLMYVNYDLSSANYTDDSGNAKSDVDDYNMRYVLNGITAKDLQNFSMGDLENTFKNKTFDSKNGNATYNLDGSVTDQGKPVLGSIIKRIISGQSVKQVRTYSGGDEADGSETYFKIDQDDLDVLGRNGKDRSALNVVAVYSDKDSTLDVNGKSIDNNTVNVKYTLNWAEGQADTAYQSNYEFAAPYVGKGDIVQRKVYVVDNGGEVVEKTYNGGKELPSDVNPASRFALSALAGKESETGLVEGEDDIRLKTKNADDTDAITGKYVSPDVARDNGKVINTAVQYEGFELEDGNTSGGGKLRNYAIAVQPEDGQANLTNSLDGNTTKVKYGTDDGKIVITEEKGGRINPKEITVNVINSPEKEYNRDFDVNGSKDGIKYASVNNLEVKIGDDVKEGGALSDTVRTISTGINNDKVTIALNGAKYEDKNVSYNDLGQVQSNKVNYFDLSWDNGNYKLVGESEDITGASGDTLTQGYDAVKATFTGRLTDYTGTINPRLIDVTKVDKVVKTYDGDAVVESNPTFNSTDADTSNPHFYIDDKDKALLVDDNLDSYLTISGNYENKNANIYPKEYSEEAAEGGKKVNYNLVWNGGDEDARKNYKFADSGEYDITGTGDILRRAVNVTDLGGDVLARDYRGTKDASLPEANLTNRFAEERNDSGTGSTGIIDADVTLNKDVIKGAYAPNGDVARDAAGNVINKAVTFSGFELQGTVDDTTGFNSKDNYYLTAQDGTVTLNGGVVSDVAHTIGKNGELLTITEDKGGRIDSKKIYISVEKSPTKVYDGDNLVKNDEKTGTAYASASNLKAAADGADVQRSFGNVNNVVSFTLDPGSGESESFDVTLEKATYDNTSTDPEKDNSMDVSRGANREVLKDKITSYNLSWTNGNYDLESEPASAEAGKQADTFAADGTNGYTDGSDKRTGVLKDYGGEITPKTISVASMDTSKTYSGKEGYVVANPQVDAEVEGIIAKDMPGNGNVQDFLGLTVGKATYGAPTQAAIDEAQAENAPKNKKATADEIAEAKPWDAAFNRTADSFQHQVAYSGIAITNGNYELADDEFDGTGTINRAVVTAHPKSATIKAGEAMPSFKGTLDGFMDGETMPKTFYTTVENEDGTTTTTSETRQVSLSEYYNDPEFIYWGPEDGVTNRTEGTNPVYGWYLRKEVGEDKDGNEVVSYYKEKEANLDKNYTLVQAEEPSTLVVEPAPRSGGGGGSGSIVSPPVRESTPVYTTPSVPTPAAPQPQPVLEVGYVEKPVVADSSVYQNVSKDTSNSTNHEAQAAIQYGRKGAGIAAGNDDSGKSSTIAIELAEVVNLLGGDVASDGSMSLTNTDSGRKLSVGSTEEGYLSVGAERKEGSIGIETEGENILEEMAAKEGSIGIESEEAQAEVRTEDKEGQIELETEEEMLDAEGKKSSISLRSEGRDGESEITYGDGDLSILNSLNADKKKEQKGEEDEEDSEKSESREGEAAIAYNDVA